MKRTAPIGMTDCATAAGIQGSDTRVVPARTDITRRPAHASTAKNARTNASATSMTPVRNRSGSMSTRVGTPMCARCRAASAAP